MSTDTRLEFDDSVRVAADCYVAAYGREAAIERLRDRREELPDGRVEEALAYLRFEAGDRDGG